MLTTMNTPFGRYCWLKIPFEMKSALETYHWAMGKMLGGIDHAYANMDDTCIAVHGIVHHDSKLKQVIHHTKNYNLKLNLDKVKVWEREVPYASLIISGEGLKSDLEKSENLERNTTPYNQGRHVLLSTVHSVPTGCRKNSPNAGKSRDAIEGTGKERCFLPLGQATSNNISKAQGSVHASTQCNASKNAIGEPLSYCLKDNQ